MEKAGNKGSEGLNLSVSPEQVARFHTLMQEGTFWGGGGRGDKPQQAANCHHRQDEH